MNVLRLLLGHARPPPCHVQDIHMYQMCGSVTPLKWKPQIAPLLAVFGSIFETVWASSVESELSHGVNYWRCRPQIRGPVVQIFCWPRPAECPWLCVHVGGKQGQWGTWLLHPWHPLKWEQLLWVTGRFTWCGLWIIRGLPCAPLSSTSLRLYLLHAPKHPPASSSVWVCLKDG